MKKWMCLAGALLAATSFFLHWLPADIQGAARWSLMLAGGLFFAGSGVFLQRQDSPLRSGRGKAMAVIAALAMAAAWHQVQPLAWVQLEIYSQTPQTRVQGLQVDGEVLPLSHFLPALPSWEIRDRQWVAKGEEPLRWEGLARQELRLQCASGAQGVVVVYRGGEVVWQSQLAEEVVLPVREENRAPRWFLWLADAAFGLWMSLLCFAAASVWRRKLAEPPCATPSAWLRRVVLLLLCGLAAVMLANYVVDPLQFYRRASYKPLWSSEQRYQNPGLAKNYDYDTVLLGTSTIENIMPPQVDEILGGRSLKLAMSGGTLYEEKQLLEAALRTGKVKQVVWFLDLMALGGPVERTEGGPDGFPAYLYSDNAAYASLRYLLDPYTNRQTLRVLARELRLRAEPTPPLVMLNTWQWKAVFGPAEVERYYQKAVNQDFKDVPQVKKFYQPSFYEAQRMQENLEQNLFFLVRKHPEVQFKVVWQPVTKQFLQGLSRQDPGFLEAVHVAQGGMEKEKLNLPNMQAVNLLEEESLQQERFYKDLVHYHTGIIGMILVKL